MTWEERARLESRIAALEESNHRLRQEVARAALQHGRVASVLAACHRLHATLERGPMLIAVHEVLVSLVGCDQAAVFERCPEPALMTVAGCFGVAETAVLPLPGTVRESILAGRLFVGVHDPGAIPRRPTVCVPLRVDGRVLGALALYRLAHHKSGLSDGDWDLLELLGAHVATALVATRPCLTGGGAGGSACTGPASAART
jgi:GAF domain-containing protein